MGSISISVPSGRLAILACGQGARWINASKKGSTPKFVKAEAKKTGVTLPAKKSSCEKGLPASSKSSSSSCNFAESSAPILLLDSWDVKRIANDVGFLSSPDRCFCEKYAFLGRAVDNAPELFARSNRPVHRIGMDLEDIFHFIHQLERISSRHIHLVDEGQNGNLPQVADFKKFAGLLFHALWRRRSP